MSALKFYGKDIRKREAWEAAHGPIPDKHLLIYLDHNPENKKVENLACVSHSVMRSMAENKLFSTDPEVTKAGIAIAEHKVSILRLIDKAIVENRPVLPEKPKITIGCKKCLKIKCKHWHFSLRGGHPLTCTKYNIPMTEITAMLEHYGLSYADWKKAIRKLGPLKRDTYLKKGKAV
jgi:hypothetical protein